MKFLYNTLFFMILLKTMISYADLSDKEDGQRSRLQKVTVSADFTKKQDLEAIQSVSIIDEKEISSRQSNNALELITDLPGVDIYGGPNRQGAEFNIRGFNRPERNIIRVDGISKFFEEYRVGSFFADPELFKQIDVVRGPVSTLYGNGAIGGVVNITTKDASDFLKPNQKYGFKGKAGYHTNNQEWLGAGYLYARPQENLDLLAVLNFRTSKESEFATGEKFIGSGIDLKNTLLKLNYTLLDAHSFSLSYQHLNDDNIAEYRQNDRGNGGLDNGFSEGLVQRDIKDDMFTASYQYQPDMNPFLDFTARFGYSDIRNEETGLDPALYEKVAENLPKGEKRLAQYKSWQLSLMNISRFKTSEEISHTLVYGIDYNFQDRLGLQYNHVTKGFDPSSSHASGKQTVYGGFFQDEITLYDRLVLVPAIRYAEYKTEGSSKGWKGVPLEWFGKAKRYSSLSPSLAIEIKATPWLSLIGGYYQGFRAPVIDEIYSHSFFYPNKRTSLELKAEKAKTHEAGFKTSFKNLIGKGDQLNTKLVYFNNTLNDKIESKRADPSTVLSYINNGSSKINGWEFESIYYRKSFYAQVTASRLRGKSITNEERGKIDTLPADKIAFRIGNHFKKWNLDLGLRSLFSAELPAERRPKSCNHGGCTLPLDVPEYTTHSIYIIWQPKFVSGLEVQLTVDNLFNKDYARHNSSVRSFGRDFRFLLSYQY